MKRVAPLAPDQNNSVLIRILRECTRLLCLTLGAGVRHQHEAAAATRDSFDVIGVERVRNLCGVLLCLDVCGLVLALFLILTAVVC